MKIEKSQARVRIYTPTTIMEGFIHKLPSGRTSDFFNANSNRFIVLTDVTLTPRFPAEAVPSVEQARSVIILRANVIEFVEILQEAD